ncbi:MAG TPA: hypothetical protein VFZ66_29625 [Herpetosiphonaceae bacterium]
MAATYELILADPFGVRLEADLSAFLSLSYTLATNTITELTLELPGTIPRALFRTDGRIAVWRSVDGRPAQLEGVWLIRHPRRKIMRSGERRLIVRAFSLLTLLDRRIVAYPAGSSFAEKSGAADALIVEVVNENLHNGIDSAERDAESGGATGVNLSAYLDLAAVASAGATVSKAFSRDNVLEVCREIADASAQAGVYVAFDVVAVNERLILQTYLQQRGDDHRFPGGISPVILSPDLGNLTDVEIDEDESEEVTAAIVGGQGDREARTIGVYADTERIGASPFNRIERLVEKTDTADITILTSEGQARVRAARPRVRISGRVQETPDTRYGVHWKHGDYVTAGADTYLIDARIDLVKIEVAGGTETIEAFVRGEQ